MLKLPPPPLKTHPLFILSYLLFRPLFPLVDTLGQALNINGHNMASSQDLTVAPAIDEFSCLQTLNVSG